MSLWAQAADLPVQIDGYDLEGLAESVSSDFLRKSTVIHLRGAGAEGIAEDVTYDAVDHEILQQAGPTLPLDTPNDVAPSAYNLPLPPPGLPDSPLPVAAEPVGFRWG